MKVKMHDGKLIIEIGMIDPPKLSRRGRGLLVATSHGFRPTGIWLHNKPLVVSLNACIRADEQPTDEDWEVAQTMPLQKAAKNRSL